MFSQPLLLVIISSVAALSFVIFLVMTISTIHSSSRRNNDYKIQLSSKQDECDKLSKFTGSLQLKCTALQKALNDSHNSYRNHINRLKPEFNKLLHQLMDSKKHYKELYVKYQECYEACEKMTAANSDMSNKIRSLENEISELKSSSSLSVNTSVNEASSENTDSARIAEAGVAAEALGIYKLKIEQLSSSNAELQLKNKRLEKAAEEIAIIRAERKENENEFDIVSQLQDKIRSLETELENRPDQSVNSIDNLSGSVASGHNATQQAEINYLRSLLDNLRKENAELNAKGLYYVKPPEFITPDSGNTFFETLSMLLSRLHDSPSVKAATVADSIGLLVAETGSREWTEGLAGIAALVNTLDQHIHSFLPFGDFRQISITDKNNITVSAFPVRISDENLNILILSAGESPSWYYVNNILLEIYGNSRELTTDKENGTNVLQYESI